MLQISCAFVETSWKTAAIIMMVMFGVLGIGFGIRFVFKYDNLQYPQKFGLRLIMNNRQQAMVVFVCLLL